MAQRASVSTNPMTLTGNPRPKPALPEDDGGPPAPESIPPWVHLIFDDSPAAPTPSRPNTRHYRPPPQHYRPGRKWDHQRDSEPALLGAPIAERQALWKPFMHSGPSPEHGGDAEGATLMSPEWAEENMAIVRRKWEENDEAEVDRNARAKGFWIFSPARRERTMRVFWVSWRLFSIPSAQCLSCNSAGSIKSKSWRRSLSLPPANKVPAPAVEEPIRAPRFPYHRPRLLRRSPRDRGQHPSKRHLRQQRPRSQQPMLHQRLHLHGPRRRLSRPAIHPLRHLGRVHEQTVGPPQPENLPMLHPF